MMVDAIGDGGFLTNRALARLGAAGLLAGLLAFGLGEATWDRFAPENVPQALGSGQVMRPTLETVAKAESRNAALTFGAMGGLLGICLGLAGGLNRRSAPAALSAGLIGLFLGTAIGAVLPLVLVEPFHRLQIDRASDDLLAPIGLHAALWCPLGAIAGLAFAVGLGRPGRAIPFLIGGLVGAILGTILYDVIGAAAAPMAGTSDALSHTRPTRLLASLLIPLGTAAGIALIGRSARRRTAPESQAGHRDHLSPA